LKFFLTQLPITVAVIGAGPLGRRLALRAAQTGFRVILEDVMPSTLRHAEETLREELSASAMPLVSFANTVEDAVREADLVIDCVPDELESKLEIFSLLDRMAPPRTVFATPTTALSIADLAHCTYRPGQCVGIAIDAKQLSAGQESETSRWISIFTTTQTTSQAEKLVLSFWERLGYSPQVERDPSEAALT
jgi:3-hydroxybutyryl-CoA dehydrogenase